MFMPAVYKETATEFGTAKGGNRWKMFMPACGPVSVTRMSSGLSRPHHITSRPWHRTSGSIPCLRKCEFRANHSLEDSRIHTQESASSPAVLVSLVKTHSTQLQQRHSSSCVWPPTNTCWPSKVTRHLTHEARCSQHEPAAVTRKAGPGKQQQIACQAVLSYRTTPQHPAGHQPEAPATRPLTANWLIHS